MHSLFTPVDTLDGSNFLRAVHSADGTLTVENFLMPVTGFQNHGQPATVDGYGKTYGLYLEVEAVLVGSTFETLTSQLWLDPHNNDGTPTVSDTNNPAFATTKGDSLLATGTMVSATLGTAPNGIRTADFVKSMTPTPAGESFLGGSIHNGTKLEEKLTTDTTNPAIFQTFNNEPGGTSVNTVTGGQSEISLQHGETILLPRVPSLALHDHHLKFIHN